jgi:carbamoyl-phosphate synthase large subunit
MTTNPHVLVTSVAAKVQLIESLVQACRDYGVRLFATDISSDSPALYFADDYQLLPQISDDNYLDALFQFCSDQQIGYIIPTRDQDLLFFAEHRNQLTQQGIGLLMSDSDTITTCSNKHQFHAACVAMGLPILPQLSPDKLHYPCVAKQAYSSAGTGVHLLSSKAALAQLLAEYPEEAFLFEPYVPYDEYTIDAFYAGNGTCIQAVARQRMIVVGGESKVSLVIDNPELVALAHRLSSAFDFSGHVTIQAFYVDGRSYLIEVNPRFGGASNLSIVAGLDSPRKLIASLCGDDATMTRVNPIQYGLKMLRYSKDLMIQNDVE